MTTFAVAAALVGIVSAAVIYGTDVFSALVLRPAAAGASDASVADLIGRVHHYGDRRLPAFGVTAILTAALTTITSTDVSARVGAGLGLVALLAWLVTYLRVSAPVNRRLRAAAADGDVPADTRSVQQRWDAVIWPRAALQTIALAGLLMATLTT